MPMTANQELDIIAQIRSEVKREDELTGENLFLVWGYPTVFFLILEFVTLKYFNENWCSWLWVGIPIVGAPLMFYYLEKDYKNTGRRTHEANIALKMWIFVGYASCLGGFTMGMAGVFEQCYCSFQGLLIAMGCFVTGIILRYRPKTICGIAGSAISFLSLFFQGDLWPWQLLIAAIVAVITLIIPGHLYNHYVKTHGI